MNIFGKRGDLPFFNARESARTRKAWFRLRMSRTLFAAKHLSQTQLDDIAHRPAIVCRSRGGLSANEKEEHFASNDNKSYSSFFQFAKPLNGAL